MTILNEFVKASEAVAEKLSSYYISRDSNDLQAAIDLLKEQAAMIEEEVTAPELQETKILLTKLDSESLIKVVEACNAVTLFNSDYLAEAEIIEGKFIRVITKDQEEGSVYLMRVTAYDNDRVILAPVVLQ